MLGSNINVSTADLRLLAILLEERHVSRTAARAHLSQPAMSRALQRLRIAFGDELLVRGDGVYRLTPRAERIERELPVLLGQLDALVGDAEFDPASASNAFRILGTDYIARVLAPRLLPRLLDRSPRSTVSFESWNDRVFDDLERGRSDVAIRAVPGREGLRSEELFGDRYVCVMATDHPYAGKKRLTLKQYLGCRHIAVDLGEGRQPTVDGRLEASESARDIVLRAPHFDTAVATARATRLVATVPLGVALGPDLAIVAVPREIERLSFRLVWHPRLDAEPAQQWLRDLIRSVGRDIAAERRRRGPSR